MKVRDFMYIVEDIVYQSCLCLMSDAKLNGCWKKRRKKVYIECAEVYNEYLPGLILPSVMC